MFAALTDADVAFVCSAARGRPGRVTLATMLAVRRDFGTFPTLSDVPAETVAYLSAWFGLEKPPVLIGEDDAAKTLHRYRGAVRAS